MIIDLSKWNEYIAGDTEPDSIPCECELEMMVIIFYTGHRKTKVDGLPDNVIPDLCSVKDRIFWRLEQ